MAAEPTSEQNALLLIGDSADWRERLRIGEAVTTSGAWPGATPEVITADGRELFSVAQARVFELLKRGPDTTGAIILDLNWGIDAGTLGCDFVQWLRVAGYRQPVLVRSAYVDATGALIEPAASKLPPQLGWQVWGQGSAKGWHIEDGWPPPLDEAQFSRALESTYVFVRSQQRYLHRVIYQSSGAGDWTKARQSTSELLLPRESEYLLALIRAIDSQDPIAVRDALADLEQVASAGK